MEALKQGNSVIFYRMSDLIISLETKEELSFARFHNSLKKFSILILDDFGLEILSVQTILRLKDNKGHQIWNVTTIITNQNKISDS